MSNLFLREAGKRGELPRSETVKITIAQVAASLHERFDELIPSPLSVLGLVG